MHRNDNAAQHSRKWAAARMDEDELDLVAAAGNGEGAGDFTKEWRRME